MKTWKWLKGCAVIGLILGLLVAWNGTVSVAFAQPLPGGTLAPTSITKYAEPLLIPPAMPQTAKTKKMPKNVDYYEIAVRQFAQQILPANMPATTVWGYGSVNHPGSFSYPTSTIEANVNRQVRVKWINDLKDPLTGNFLPHLLPVDQTLHWANPPRGCIDGKPGPDCRGQSQALYTGPVPIVPHLHGAHVGPESDGYPEAWYLPDANNIPADYANRGTHFGQIPGAPFESGAALFQYRNDQRATTLWFHDHTLGMTRLNIYAGPTGFYLLRGGPSDLPAGVLPEPAPAPGDPPGKKYYEIPIVIQDKSFNEDGSLFYPDSRVFFDGFGGPYIGGQTPSDVSPIWNPEFFGNTMVVNGKTWPKLTVEPRRYRFRFLNASDSRFLILKLVTGDPNARPGNAALPFWQIGADGGFLPAPVVLDQLLIGLAERADVIVDFTGLPVGTEVFLINEGPDEPFGGGVPGVDFPFSDPGTTGQVMKFVVGPLTGTDTSKAPATVVMPRFKRLGTPKNTRQLSLNESVSSLICLDGDGNVVDCPPPDGGDFAGPIAAKLGTLNPDGTGNPLQWEDPITENIRLEAIEIWEIHNFTEDAHPIHLHLVQFEVINREDASGTVRPPEPWETGTKDTVISYPGEITRIKARFDKLGLYLWHCHIVSHEDNEMMRPFFVGKKPKR